MITVVKNEKCIYNNRFYCICMLFLTWTLSFYPWMQCQYLQVSGAFSIPMGMISIPTCTMYRLSLVYIIIIINHTVHTNSNFTLYELILSRDRLYIPAGPLCIPPATHLLLVGIFKNKYQFLQYRCHSSQ